MSFPKPALASVFICIAFTFTACGGGGGGGGSESTGATPITSFPLQAGYRTRVAAGSADSFTISGTCSGTATITTSATSPATFEGVSGYSSGQTATINFTNCTPASNAVTGTLYHDASYTPLGSSIPGVEYTKFQTAPPPLPTTVKVGDTAVYATVTVYTDSTKATLTGQRQLSYVVEADSASTAFVILITRSYNTANQLLFTSQSKYRIASDGTLTIFTIDVQYSTTSTVHLLYTKA